MSLKKEGMLNFGIFLLLAGVFICGLFLLGDFITGYVVFENVSEGGNYTLPFRVNLSSNLTGNYYSFIDLDKSLVFYMRMDDLNGSGQPVDLSDYGNNGSLVGTPVINSTGGIFGNRVILDGSGDYINIVDSNSLDSPGVSGELTICAWFNAVNHMSNWRGIVGKYNSGGRAYLLAKYNSDNRYGFYLSYTGTALEATVLTDSALNTSQWYHLCGRFADGTANLYLNGVQQSASASLAGINAGSSSPLQIGEFWTDDRYFNGSIDEVLIFNRSLSNDEINSLYNSSANKFDYNFSNLSLGDHTIKGYDVSGSGEFNNTGLINFNIVEASEEPVEEGELNVSFVPPTPEEDTEETSIYVNLSTNGSGNYYSFVDFDSDLVAWFRMDDEDVGTLVDKSSYHNDGVFMAGAETNSSGIFGKALEVNDTSYVTVLDSSSLDSPGVADEITVCAWFNANTHGSDFTGIVAKYDTLSGSNRQYLLAKNNADNRYGFFLSSTGASYDADVFTNSALNTDQWYHLCGTSNGTVLLYLDGILQTQTDTLAGGIVDNTAANLTIGNFGRANSEFDGLIDEVLVFKRALTETEIKSIYNSSANKYEHNFTGLSENSHTFTGYVVNQTASYLSTSRTISTGVTSSAPTLDLISNTSYENFFNMEYQLNVTNSPDSCVFSRDGTENVSLVNMGGGIFLSSESLEAGIYNITFYCNNSYGAGSLEEQFILRKSITQEHTYFTNSEGLDIYFDFYFNYTSENGPLLLVPDSWSSTKDSYRTPVMTAFRPEGYSVVLVDTRGKGSSEGSRGALDYECIDIYEVIEHVRNHGTYGDFIGNEVYIWGFSAGGGRAGACSARYPDLFSGIFSTGGVLNITAWYSLNPSYQSDLQTRIGGTPTTNPEGYQARDASFLCYNALSPAMVTHYQGDASVNVELSRDYNYSMNYYEKEIRYDEYPAGSHAIVGLADSILYFDNHTEIYSIPASGDFVLSGFLFTKNFTIRINDMGKIGHVYYNISNGTRQFNISTLTYDGFANVSVLDLNASTNYTIRVDGNETTRLSDSSGDLTFNVSLTNSSLVVIIISPTIQEYCGDGFCNNGETCSSCSQDCGACPSSSSSSSGGGGGGGGFSAPAVVSGLNKLELAELDNLIFASDTSKELTFKVRNAGTNFLNGCKLKSSGQYSSWISGTGAHSLSAGEVYNFPFSLAIPQNAKAGDYNIPLRIECQETSENSSISFEVIEKKFDFELLDVERVGFEQVNISYKLEELSEIDQNVEIQFLLFSDKEKVAEVKESVLLESGSVRNSVISIPIERDLEGELTLLVNLNSETYSSFVQEDILLNSASPIGGFAIFDEQFDRDRVLIFILVSSFLAFAFCILRRIIKIKKFFK